MSSTIQDSHLAAILAVVERTPKWIRHDLTSSNAAARSRAEESLAAQIASALDKVRPTSGG